MTIVAGECKVCGADVMVLETRMNPNFHDCKCNGCGRLVEVTWGASIRVQVQETTDPPPGYTISKTAPYGWYVHYTADRSQDNGGPYDSRDAAIGAALIFQGRE